MAFGTRSIRGCVSGCDPSAEDAADLADGRGVHERSTLALVKEVTDVAKGKSMRKEKKKPKQKK